MSGTLDHSHTNGVDATTCATCIRRRHVAEETARRLAAESPRAIARRVPWRPTDERQARHAALVIGRADVELAVDGESSMVPGVIVSSCDQRSYGDRRVLYFDLAGALRATTLTEAA